MTQTSMEISMSDDLQRRLHEIAPRAGKTVQEFVREAIYTFVEDYEDGLAAQASIMAQEPTISLHQMRNELGLGNRDLGYSKNTA